MRDAIAPLDRQLARPARGERAIVTSKVRVSAKQPTGEPGQGTRLRGLVDAYFDFIWRSLRRLGVTYASVDDAAQRVFWVASQNLDDIDPRRERSFLFGVAVRVASECRRGDRRRREVNSDEHMDAAEHPSPGPEELLDQKRARETLDELLDDLSLELRTVLVLVEGEGLKAHEVAEILAIPEGTVSSRLRRARVALAEAIQRLQRRSESRRGRT
jgi:RNA polymerase sigma-70 factor (ECF subfamily)